VSIRNWVWVVVAVSALAAVRVSAQTGASDARVSKAIQLGDRRKLEFVAQVFNVFGTDNLFPPGAGSYVDNALSDSFGKILSAQPRQQGEVAIR